MKYPLTHLKYPKNKSTSLSNSDEVYTLQHFHSSSIGSKGYRWDLGKAFTLIFSSVISVIEHTEAFSQSWGIVSKNQTKVSREGEAGIGLDGGLQ